VRLVGLLEVHGRFKRHEVARRLGWAELQVRVVDTDALEALSERAFVPSGECGAALCANCAQEEERALSRTARHKARSQTAEIAAGTHSGPEQGALCGQGQTNRSTGPRTLRWYPPWRSPRTRFPSC
jgi:hypothetical protein